MHHTIWKIIFVLGAYEYLERKEGKIRKGLFSVKDVGYIFWGIKYPTEALRIKARVEIMAKSLKYKIKGP